MSGLLGPLGCTPQPLPEGEPQKQDPEDSTDSADPADLMDPADESELGGGEDTAAQPLLDVSAPPNDQSTDENPFVGCGLGLGPDGYTNVIVQGLAQEIALVRGAVVDVDLFRTVVSEGDCEGLLLDEDADPGEPSEPTRLELCDMPLEEWWHAQGELALPVRGYLRYATAEGTQRISVSGEFSAVVTGWPDCSNGLEGHLDLTSEGDVSLGGPAYLRFCSPAYRCPPVG